MADIRLEQLLHTAADNPIGTTNGALDVHVTASSGLATDTKLEQARALLAVLTDVDYATEAGQANIAAAIAGLSAIVATDSGLAAVAGAIAELADRDFATQTTLAAVLTALGSQATAAKQDAAKAVLDAIAASATTAAKEATLAAIRTALTNGTQKVQVTASSGLATDTKLEQVRALLQALTGKDYAKDATLALVIAALDSIQAEVAATKAAVQSANAMKLFGASLSDRPPAGSVPVGTTFTLPNEDLDTWISDGTGWVAV